ncbi:MAG: YbcC family protein [Polymorphobacter sp.]|uniref:YbcC family protein n=1 Tax=Polymorphobacter sp. TaxID=1909290 RepID=UPI003A8B53A5
MATLLDHPTAQDRGRLARAHTDKAAEAAARRMAPLWPLKHFVAVNPFVGMIDMPFAEAAQRVAQTIGARMTRSRVDYGDAIREGRLTTPDIQAALAETARTPGLPTSAAEIRLRAVSASQPPALPARLPTVATVVASYRDIDWPRLITDHISSFAARQFDEGEAAWAAASRACGPWSAFRDEAAHDRSLELIGLSGMRATIAAMPRDAQDAILHGARTLGLSQDGLEIYFHRLLADISGWAGHARYRLWQAELHGKTDTALRDLLAIRLACDAALLGTLLPGSPALTAWEAAVALINGPQPVDSEITIDCVLQLALEKAYARGLAGALASVPTASEMAKTVQAVFCIDVRSEPFRRAFESTSPAVETLGFAGFFGLALDYVPLGQHEGQARCPVLLAPGVKIHEHVEGACAHETGNIIRDARLTRRKSGALSTFKRAAVASFAFVETLGPSYAVKLISDSLGLTRPVPAPANTDLPDDVTGRLGPDMSSLDVETMTAAGETMLRAMSLTSNFAPLVMFVGHGGSSVNNPHATGLDCGACGGYDGAPNARVAARILNHPQVRAGLAARGIDVPADTWFMAALHNTTTDHVEIFDEAHVPEARAGDLASVKKWLSAAGRQSRVERATHLSIDPASAVDPQIEARANDWSQVRPEWGLANCAAFIAAPRSRTAGLNLEGRSFLHSYEWQLDAPNGFPVLSLIMNAPMVVASWISLQYYGSAADNHAFGSGNKLLHNAVGGLGVLEGNGGDLRTGLPMQSVHDGEKLMHEPLRLKVLIEAPMAAMDKIIADSETVRNLLENQWLHLAAIGEDGRLHHWRSAGVWMP